MQRITYAYGTTSTGTGLTLQNTAGRLSQITYSGPHSLNYTEWYSYAAPGGVALKRLQLSNGYTNHLDASYTYDSEGRMASVQYPNANGASGAPVASYTYGFDSLGRLNTMTDQHSNLLVSGVTYNPANQPTNMTGIVNETRSYTSTCSSRSWSRAATISNTTTRRRKTTAAFRA